MSKYKKLCPHFHISMQSGNDDVLKRMNRKYSKDTLIKVCNDLRTYFDDPYLASDVIVGFPKETDEEFNDTINTINNMELSEVHVFKYSKRKYTLASKMDGQIDGSVKKQRSNEVLNLSRVLKQKFLEKYLGKKVQVLFSKFCSNLGKFFNNARAGGVNLLICKCSLG